MITDLLSKGRAVQREKRSTEELAKLGTVRGGNVGALVDGKYYGTCHRKTHLRQQGLEYPPEPYTDLMFPAGYNNEDIIIDELLAAGCTAVAGDSFMTDLGNGLNLGTTPDIIIKSPDGSTGIEAKLVCSIHTALGVGFKLQPKEDHLLQAALYSHLTGLPYKLYYASRVYWHTLSVSSKDHSLLVGRDDVEWSEKTGKAKRIVPFEREYSVEWTDKGLRYQCTSNPAPPMLLPIIPEHILDYYKASAAIANHQDLGPRPAAKSLQGDFTGWKCMKDYCPFSESCANYDKHKDYAQWRSDVTNLIKENQR